MGLHQQVQGILAVLEHELQPFVADQHLAVGRGIYRSGPEKYHWHNRTSGHVHQEGQVCLEDGSECEPLPRRKRRRNLRVHGAAGVEVDERHLPGVEDALCRASLAVLFVRQGQVWVQSKSQDKLQEHFLPVGQRLQSPSCVAMRPIAQLELDVAPPHPLRQAIVHGQAHSLASAALAAAFAGFPLPPVQLPVRVSLATARIRGLAVAVVASKVSRLRAVAEATLVFDEGTLPVLE
mmetsp:Transcript_47892/g.154480  ORF Transcript_47892/g.154480 Transcript_47892/m.154480 type:complete len:236 (-) Transcript_47892:2897-3604(-)